MKLKGSIAVFAVAAAFAGSVAATDIQECKTRIVALSGLTATAPFTNEKDRTAEQGKLAEATLKLDARKPKYADAQTKMGDYITKLNQVYAAGKFDDPGQTLYLELYNGAMDVVTCIDEIPK